MIVKYFFLVLYCLILIFNEFGLTSAIAFLEIHQILKSSTFDPNK